jgi:site-specific recombinase XerD
MTNDTQLENTMLLEQGLNAFLDALLGKNRSSATLRAYRTDVRQFITFLHETLVSCPMLQEVEHIQAPHDFQPDQG